MADELLSLQGRQQAARAMRRRLVITLVAALVLIGAGWITLWAAGGSPAVAPAPHGPAASRRPSGELLETTRSCRSPSSRPWINCRSFRINSPLSGRRQKGCPSRSRS